MKTVIASTLVVLSSMALQAPEAFSQSHDSVSLQTQQNTLIAGQLKTNRRSPRPSLGRPNRLQGPLSVVGNWSGGMHSKGDDALAHFQLSIPSGQGANKQGTWKLIGQQGVMAQGPASIQVQGNTVNLDFQNYYGQTLELQGSFQNGGQKIAGHDVNNPNYVFAFTK